MIRLLVHYVSDENKLIYTVFVCIYLLCVIRMELAECQQLKQMTVNLVLIYCDVSQLYEFVNANVIML
jgi:hypothetical protein